MAMGRKGPSPFLWPEDWQVRGGCVIISRVNEKYGRMFMTITKDIRYIGVDDKTIDLFEGQYVVPNGVSYNS